MKYTATQIEIETVLRALGGVGTKKGFTGIIWGVTFALEEPDMLYEVTKGLYPAIAEQMGMTVTAILRDMRSVVTLCWDMGDRETMNEVAGRKLMDKPTVGEFIDMMTGYLRRRGL